MVHGSEHYFLCDKKNKNKKSSVSVPRFYKNKPACPNTTPAPKQPAKPQVVIRRGGPVPEIIKSGQRSKMSNQEGIKFPDFQEANPLTSRPFHTEPHVLGEVNAINTD